MPKCCSCPTPPLCSVEALELLFVQSAGQGSLVGDYYSHVSQGPLGSPGAASTAHNHSSGPAQSPSRITRTLDDWVGLKSTSNDFILNDTVVSMSGHVQVCACVRVCAPGVLYLSVVLCQALCSWGRAALVLFLIY